MKQLVVASHLEKGGKKMRLLLGMDVFSKGPLFQIGFLQSPNLSGAYSNIQRNVHHSSQLE